jgi:hypothetical protein
LIETAKIVCPNKLKDFQSISLTWNTVAECIGDSRQFDDSVV